MYVCMNVCMYVCVYVYGYVCMYRSTFVGLTSLSTGPMSRARIYVRAQVACEAFSFKMCICTTQLFSFNKFFSTR